MSWPLSPVNPDGSCESISYAPIEDPASPPAAYRWHSKSEAFRAHSGGKENKRGNRSLVRASKLGLARVACRKAITPPRKAHNFLNSRSRPANKLTSSNPAKGLAKKLAPDASRKLIALVDNNIQPPRVAGSFSLRNGRAGELYQQLVGVWDSHNESLRLLAEQQEGRRVTKQQGKQQSLKKMKECWHALNRAERLRSLVHGTNTENQRFSSDGCSFSDFWHRCNERVNASSPASPSPSTPKTVCFSPRRRQWEDSELLGGFEDEDEDTEDSSAGELGGAAQDDDDEVGGRLRSQQDVEKQGKDAINCGTQDSGSLSSKHSSPLPEIDMSDSDASSGEESPLLIPPTPRPVKLPASVRSFSGEQLASATTNSDSLQAIVNASRSGSASAVVAVQQVRESSVGRRAKKSRSQVAVFNTPFGRQRQRPHSPFGSLPKSAADKYQSRALELSFSDSPGGVSTSEEEEDFRVSGSNHSHLDRSVAKQPTKRFLAKQSVPPSEVVAKGVASPPLGARLPASRNLKGAKTSGPPPGVFKSPLAEPPPPVPPFAKSRVKRRHAGKRVMKDGHDLAWQAVREAAAMLCKGQNFLGHDEEFAAADSARCSSNGSDSIPPSPAWGKEREGRMRVKRNEVRQVFAFFRMDAQGGSLQWCDPSKKAVMSAVPLRSISHIYFGVRPGAPAAHLVTLASTCLSIIARNVTLDLQVVPSNFSASLASSKSSKSSPASRGGNSSLPGSATVAAWVVGLVGVLEKAGCAVAHDYVEPVPAPKNPSNSSTSCTAIRFSVFPAPRTGNPPSIPPFLSKTCATSVLGLLTKRPLGNTVTSPPSAAISTHSPPSSSRQTVGAKQPTTPSVVRLLRGGQSRGGSTTLYASRQALDSAQRLMLGETRGGEETPKSTPVAAVGMDSGAKVSTPDKSEEEDSLDQIEPGSPKNVPLVTGTLGLQRGARQAAESDEKYASSGSGGSQHMETTSEGANKLGAADQQAEGDVKISYRWKGDAHSEAVQRRLETLQQFKALRLERPVLIKHGRRGFPHKSHLVINEERLYWNWKEWKKLSPSPKNVPLATVTTVVKGRRSKVLKRVSHKKDKLLFTVVSATKELHLQAASERDRDLWVAGLTLMAEMYKKKEGIWDKPQH